MYSICTQWQVNESATTKNEQGQNETNKGKKLD